MAKELASRTELELIALQEIRSFPGAELVISVEIESDFGQSAGINWTLHVVAKEGADLDRIHYAAKTTSDRLKRRYDLRSG
ncbi:MULTISPECIES: hypothetical protein [unclassified Bradyrhizobium]|uniref:hypothetical protein n=1 Tax=unclassified Bradyrhizobium TaxID=2631580 RepID=UPI000406BE73|nr:MULTISPECIES: hypothetical protein [unclassified Bradyrhizobium]MCP3459334.1 hypothetical protein [Bradyrhizobium sp. CCGUVB23]